MDRYLARLERGLGRRRLRIMQSNGGLITAHTARREAARKKAPAAAPAPAAAEPAAAAAPAEGE